MITRIFTSHDTYTKFIISISHVLLQIVEQIRQIIPQNPSLLTLFQSVVKYINQLAGVPFVKQAQPKNVDQFGLEKITKHYEISKQRLKIPEFCGNLQYLRPLVLKTVRIDAESTRRNNIHSIFFHYVSNFDFIAAVFLHTSGQIGSTFLN